MPRRSVRRRPSFLCVPSIITWGFRQACVIADALTEIEIPVEFYCQVQYNMVFMFPKCLMNPHCDYSFEAMRCTASDSTMRLAWGRGFEVKNTDHFAIPLSIVLEYRRWPH